MLKSCFFKKSHSETMRLSVMQCSAGQDVVTCLSTISPTDARSVKQYQQTQANKQTTLTKFPEKNPINRMQAEYVLTYFLIRLSKCLTVLIISNLKLQTSFNLFSIFGQSLFQYLNFIFNLVT